MRFIRGICECEIVCPQCQFDVLARIEVKDAYICPECGGIWEPYYLFEVKGPHRKLINPLTGEPA